MHLTAVHAQRETERECNHRVSDGFGSSIGHDVNMLSEISGEEKTPCSPTIQHNPAHTATGLTISCRTVQLKLH